jgi:hypothetical protein
MGKIVVREDPREGDCSDPFRGVECQNSGTHQEGAGHLIAVQRPDIPAPGGTNIESRYPTNEKKGGRE